MQLTIEKLVYGGDGLARLPADDKGRGKAAFIPFVLPGEDVEATLVEQKPGYVRARAKAILRPSEVRIEPGCPYFATCGGCHYQHASYEEQLRIKSSILRENLRRIAKIELADELVVHASPPWNYRNRTRFRVHSAPQFAIGFYQVGSHKLLPVEQCPISSPFINRALAVLWEMGRTGGMEASVEEIELFANADDSQLLAEAYCGPSPSVAPVTAWAERLRTVLPEVAGVVVFPRSGLPEKTASDAKAIARSGAESLTYQTRQGAYRVSAGAFFQINRHLTDELVTAVTAGRTGRTVLDMYAGGGLFSVPLAKSFERVIAVESSVVSHADLVANGPATVKAVCASAEKYLQGPGGRIKPDLVVVDPPRSGLGDSVVRALGEMKAPRITYVSCDPATLSRDLNRLLAAGYRIARAHLVDLFPQTFHVESIVELVR